MLFNFMQRRIYTVDNGTTAVVKKHFNIRTGCFVKSGCYQTPSVFKTQLRNIKNAILVQSVSNTTIVNISSRADAFKVQGHHLKHSILFVYLQKKTLPLESNTVLDLATNAFLQFDSGPFSQKPLLAFWSARSDAVQPRRVEYLLTKVYVFCCTLKNSLIKVVLYFSKLMVWKIL